MTISGISMTAIWSTSITKRVCQHIDSQGQRFKPLTVSDRDLADLGISWADYVDIAFTQGYVVERNNTQYMLPKMKRMNFPIHPYKGVFTLDVYDGYAMIADAIYDGQIRGRFDIDREGHAVYFQCQDDLFVARMLGIVT
jgi:hypothetical protein